ncbi:hypothetical protein IFM89_018056 [Coptis chinensis]|uniref:Ubiquitin-like domain-containing protein n=1 Tax=Coptis chinensis TaxID=261450 RepID=A0A835HYK3_9MAGN|nr:hypothetical protein IFM89_018056 [Coptis chinensis]
MKSARVLFWGKVNQLSRCLGYVFISFHFYAFHLFKFSPDFLAFVLESHSLFYLSSAFLFAAVVKNPSNIQIRLNMDNEMVVVKVVSLEIEIPSTIEDIKAKFLEKERILVDDYELYDNEGCALGNASSSTIESSQNILEESRFFLLLHPMEIYVEMEHGLSVAVTVENYDSISSVKAKIHDS